jgi:hypothetical protein
MNEIATICKNCNAEKVWHIAPMLNCPGSRSYHENIFFEPMPAEKTPTPAEIIASNDELFSKILAQLDAINSDIQTINNTLKSIQ